MQEANAEVAALLSGLPLRPSLVDQVVAELREVDQSFQAPRRPAARRTHRRAARPGRPGVPAAAALPARVRGSEPSRAGGPGSQARAARSEPPAGGLDRQALHEPRPVAARPDSGGEHRADEGGGPLPVPPRVQVLDLRNVVGAPGGDAGDCRLRTHDPSPGPRLRCARPADPRAACADRGAGARRRRRRSSAPASNCRSGRWSCCSRRPVSRRRSRRRSATRTRPGWPTRQGRDVAFAGGRGDPQRDGR